MSNNNNKAQENNIVFYQSLIILLLLYVSAFLAFPSALRLVRFFLPIHQLAIPHNNLQKQVIYKASSSSLCQIPANPQSAPVSSSRRDVIFLYTTKFNSGLELAIKSLKSALCQAQIVLFTHEAFIITAKSKQIFSQNGVTVIESCKDPDHSSIVPHMHRFKCEQEFLSKNIDKYDRVLHSDAYDVFFQKDPFVEEMISRDKLTFVIEPHFIRGCGWNLNWFKSCYGVNLTEKIQNNFIVCSGTISGGANQYLKLLNLMLSQKEWNSCYTASRDQPILNYLLWSGEIRRNGINYRLSGCDGGFATLQWCILNQEVTYNDNKQVVLPSKVVPAYLHQYPRLQNLSEHLHKACGVKQFDTF